MKPPRLPQIALRRKTPMCALPLGKNLYETLVESEFLDNPIANALRLARGSSITGVLVSTESSNSSRWRILTTDPNVDLAWLGEQIPHRKPLKTSGPSKGSYTRTFRGTWRIGMQVIPVVDESVERSRLISYRGPSGISVQIKDGKILLGFTLESANPRDGTQICQSVLLNAAADIGVRCEIIENTSFATIVDELTRVRNL